MVQNKRWMKRVLSILLVFCLVCASPLGALAEGELPSGGGRASENIVSAVINEDSNGNQVSVSLDKTTGVLTVSGVGSTGDYAGASSVPDIIKNNRADIRSLVVEDGITRLGNKLFSSCTNLASVDFSQNRTLTELGNGTFQATALTQIRIPESVTVIGNVCFYECTQLQSVVIEGEVTALENRTFTLCQNLTSITLPSTVTAFPADSSNRSAFYKCGNTDGQTTIYYGGTEAQWAAAMANPDSSVCAANLSTYRINVVCANTVPGGQVAASGTTGSVNWQLVTKTGSSGTVEVGVLTLSGNGATADYASGTNAEKAAPWLSHMDNITKVVVEDGVTSLGKRLFYGADNLTEVIFPRTSLTRIGEGTFRACTSLQTITLPASLTNLERVSFYGCTALKDITIRGSMTTLPDQIVAGCTALETVALPETLTSLTANDSGKTTFFDCGALDTINFDGTVHQWKLVLARSIAANPAGASANDVLRANLTVNCADGTYHYDPSEVLPDPDAPEIWDDSNAVQTGTVGEVSWMVCPLETDEATGNVLTYVLTIYGAGSADGGFTDGDQQPWKDYSDRIVKVVVGQGVTRLGDFMFWHKQGSAIEEVVFPSTSLTYIGNGAFRKTALKNLVLPSSLTHLGRVAFYDCAFLETLSFGGVNSSLSTLYDQVITNCDRLTTITLPASMTTFNLKANSTSEVGPFYKNKIKTIHYGGTVNQWKALLQNTNASEVKSTNIIVYCTNGTYIDGSIGNGIVYTLEKGVLTLKAMLDTGDMVDFTSASAVPWADKASTITKVVIKNEITRIGANAFANCTNIGSIVYVGNASGWTALRQNSGSNNQPLFRITPTYLTSGSCGTNAAFTYDIQQKKLVISGTGALNDYTSGSSTPWGVIRDEIKTVVVGSGITHIGSYMFNKFTELTSITLSDGLESVGRFGMGQCSSLTEIVFGSGLKHIGSKAFSGSINLERITLPGTLETVDMKAFEKVNYLTDVYYDGTEGQWNRVMISKQALGNDFLLNANLHYLRSPQTFADVAADSPCLSAVTYLTDNGYLTVSGDAFGVETVADVEMILNILYTRAGRPGMYTSVWEWGTKNGLTASGTNESVSLSSLAVILYRMAVLNGQLAAGTSADEASAAMAWCTQQQYFAQINTNGQTLTRGEAALIMAAYLQSTASVADREELLKEIMQEALTKTGGDGMFYIYALDLPLENASSKQGDCFLLLFPNGETMLIDTAASASEATVLGMLEAFGITELDYLVFSHSDSDHVGNGVAVVNYLNGNIGKLYLNNAMQYSAIVAALPDASSKTVYLRRGDVLQIGGVRVDILNPTAAYIDSFNAGTITENNDSSIAMKFTYGQSTFLTCGDLYAAMENELISVYGSQLQADIMKANHHAAYTSNVEEWLDAVDPLVMFAETDDNGNAELMNSAAQKGIAYYTYGLDGTILITMDNHRNYEVMTQKDSVLRTNYTGEIGKAAGN